MKKKVKKLKLKTILEGSGKTLDRSRNAWKFGHIIQQTSSWLPGHHEPGGAVTMLNVTFVSELLTKANYKTLQLIIPY